MTARALLERLHTRNMALESYGLTFRLDAQTEAVTDELRHALRGQEEPHPASRAGTGKAGGSWPAWPVVIKWARKPRYIALRIPPPGS